FDRLVDQRVQGLSLLDTLLAKDVCGLACGGHEVDVLAAPESLGEYRRFPRSGYSVQLKDLPTALEEILDLLLRPTLVSCQSHGSYSPLSSSKMILAWPWAKPST